MLASKEFAELRLSIKNAGLLEKQPFYYLHKTLVTLALLATGWILLLGSGLFWLQLLSAAFLGFVYTQIGFIVHDLGHRQAFRKAWTNDVSGIFLSNFLLGASYGRWVDMHNQHHRNPNHVELDPDIAEVPVAAFTEKQALAKRGVLRFIAKYQAFFFFPLLACLAPISVRINSLRFLFTDRAKYVPLEILLLVCHFTLYFGLLFYFFDSLQALLLIAVHQTSFGLYMVSVFATSHKGMLYSDSDSSHEYLRCQVMVARNLKPHPVTDFLSGPLASHVEHHLFPSMSRNKLRKAMKIIKPFCDARSIDYYETGFFQSYREILQFLHQVGAPLRKKGKPAKGTRKP